MIAPMGSFTPAEAKVSEPQLDKSGDPKKLRETFDQFVGESFYGQLLKSMRQTTDKPAYFHGGRAEEVFQGQLDQQLVTHISEASASQVSGPMFELFQMQRMN